MKPIVSTRGGAEGLTFADGTEILLRDDAARAKAIQDDRTDRIQGAGRAPAA